MKKSIRYALNPKTGVLERCSPPKKKGKPNPYYVDMRKIAHIYHPDCIKKFTKMIQEHLK